MHLSPIIRILSFFLAMLAVSLTVPAIFSLIIQDGEFFVFLLSIFSCAFLGGAMYFLPYNKSAITFQSGFALVTLAWILLSVCGGLPYLFGDHLPSFTDAFFETMSGFTTTGATVFKDLNPLPPSLILWRSMTQWLGGMGIVVLFLAVVPFFDTEGMSLYQAEVAGPVVDKIRPRLDDTAKILWLGYLGATIAGVVALFFAGMSLFDAVNHSMTALSTGGFSNRNISIEFYNSFGIEVVLILLMIIGCTNFTLHYRFFTKRLRIKEYFRDTEFRTMILVIIILAGLASIANSLASGQGILSSFRHSLFNVVSVISTTGYSSTDFNLWPLFSQVLLMMLMIAGGCAGSTTGGVKIIRILLIFKMLKTELMKMLHPSGVSIIKVNRANISANVIRSTAFFVLMYIFCILASVVLVSFQMEDLKTALSAVLTCVGNVGPGLGGVGPASNFAELGSFTKWVLSFDMLIGRLEIMTVIILFYPRFWRGS